MLGHVGALPYPFPASPDVTRRMQRNPRHDTAPEIALRSELHARGLRFRKDLPLRVSDRVIRPDVVLTRARVAVFVDGCFWHQCPAHGTMPKRNRDYWQPKLARNVARDRRVDEALAGAGWLVVRGWEHESPAQIADRVDDAIAISDSARPSDNLA